MYIPRRALYHSTLRLATHQSCSVRLLTTTAKQPPSFSTKTRNFVLGTASIFATVLFLDYYFDSRAAIHKYFLMPVLRGVIDAEDAHRLAIWSAKWGLSASDRVISYNISQNLILSCLVSRISDYIIQHSIVFVRVFPLKTLNFDFTSSLLLLKCLMKIKLFTTMTALFPFWQPNGIHYTWERKRIVGYHE